MSKNKKYIVVEDILSSSCSTLPETKIGDILYL